MTYFVAVRCKTEDCETWIRIRQIHHEDRRSIETLLNSGQLSQRLSCPKCKKRHDYSATDRDIVET